jgi:uncharacterized protein (DUF779 family)
MFHQSGGCCDGSLDVFEEGRIYINETDILLGGWGYSVLYVKDQP